jgi:hypothetical protein
MIVFNLFSRYFWLLGLVITVTNWLGFRRRAQKCIEKNPQLEQGYAPLIRGYLFYMSLPWVVMGIGCTIGGVPSIWSYFRPRDGNPYILAWFGSVLFLWVLGTFWLFFKGGAEVLARHPGALEFRCGLRSKDITSPSMIKALWLLVLASGIIATVTMWFMNIPIPNFR